MENNEKIRVSQEYSKLSDDLKEQMKLVYPEGFSQFLFQYTNKDGARISAIRFETDAKIYLIRMSALEAEQIIADDSDYDSEGYLREDVRDDYEDKYSDIDYLSDNENYEG
ncbi:hypothetical protein BFP72_01905 [Reichenbachiella sp. 5M10]|uniref:hypothetical protein n=1 Tax=Reichenbachiella sp. 5M10 TaxID=1889772 RepID=UPI000C14DF0F|nr:hypothetical protein [Reichenbachiella sp. 5M10]PIB34272.1 hypothetical protein BFP72_01905 [Reichenbachiella sp. 5M10]